MELDLVKMFTVAGTVGARVTGLLMVAPMLGGIAVITRVKIALALVLTAFLYPLVTQTVSPSGFVSWTELALREMAVGLVLGFALQLVFEAAQFAGQVLGVQMGFSLVNVLDPQTQVDTPVLGIFCQLVTLLIFLQLNVHHWLLRGLARSFRYIPPGAFQLSRPTIEEVLRASGSVLLCGVQIAAPALAATLLADIALGFLGKASPQLPVLFVGLSVKSVLGLTVLVLIAGAWPRYFEQQFLVAIETSERVLSLAH